MSTRTAQRAANEDPKLFISSATEGSLVYRKDNGYRYGELRVRADGTVYVVWNKPPHGVAEERTPE